MHDKKSKGQGAGLERLLQVVATASNTHDLLIQVTSDALLLQTLLHCYHHNYKELATNQDLLHKRCTYWGFGLDHFQSQIRLIVHSLNLAPSQKDYYSFLGLSRDASLEEIKQAFRSKSFECHPDLHPEDPEAEERFKELFQVYEILSDPELRKNYDQQLQRDSSWKDISCLEGEDTGKKRSFRFRSSPFVVVSVCVSLLILAAFFLDYRNIMSQYHHSSWSNYYSPNNKASKEKIVSSKSKSSQSPELANKTLEGPPQEIEASYLNLQDPLQTPEILLLAKESGGSSKDNSPESTLEAKENKDTSKALEKKAPNSKPQTPEDKDSSQKKETKHLASKSELTPQQASIAVSKEEDNKGAHQEGAERSNKAKGLEDKKPEPKKKTGQVQRKSPGLDRNHTVGRAEKSVVQREKPSQPSKDFWREKILSFLQHYTTVYESQDLRKFLHFFTPRAQENGKPIRSLKRKYRNTFQRLKEIDYKIKLQEFSSSKSKFRVKGKFQILATTQDRAKIDSTGNISFILVPYKQTFRVRTLDYTFSKNQ